MPNDKQQLSDEERQKIKEEYDADIEKMYASLGRFVIAFENVCHSMHLAIVLILQKHGLQNQSMTNALLAGMTADPLRSAFMGVLGTLEIDDPTGKKVIQNTLRRVQELTRKRNDIIHNHWFVPGLQMDLPNLGVFRSFPGALGNKWKNTKEGPKYHFPTHTAEDFNNLTLEAKLLRRMILHIYGCVSEGCEFEKDFVLDEQGNYQVSDYKRYDHKGIKQD